MKDEFTAQNIAESKILKIIVQLLSDPGKGEDQKGVCFEILQRLSNFNQNHEFMISRGILKLLTDNLDEFLAQDVGKLRNDQLGVLVRSFHIITNLCRNSGISENLASSRVVQKFILIHEKSKEIPFLNELFINSLHSILSNYEGVMLLKDYQIELKSLVLSSVNSSNRRLIENAESIVVRLMKNEDLKSTIVKVKGGDTSFENLAYLAFMSKNDMMSDLLDDMEHLNLAISILSQKELKSEQQFGLIKFLASVVSLNDKMIHYFDSIKGINLILSKIHESSNLIVWTEYVNLLYSLLQNMNKEEVARMIPNEPFQQLTSFFEKMNSILDSFQKNALTPEKAHDSLEYNKNDVTRALLCETKSIKPEEIVPNQMALDYISAEHFAVSVFNLFHRVGECKGLKGIQITEEFIKTCEVLMKVFKNSKTIYEKMFGMLASIEINSKIGVYIVKAGWPFNLCDVLIKKPNWKFFAYYVLRFMGSLTKDKEVEKIIKGNSSAIKLIASIKNFINEEDYKDFDDTESEGNDTEARDVLSFAQEREVYKKGIALVSALTDSSTLQTFKSNIDRSIKNFKAKSEAIMILRAEYAVITCLNGDNFFGNEGLKNSIHKILAQNITDLERAVQGRHFIDKEKLMADCIRSIANFVCITWNESGKNAYEKANVSTIVFGLLEKYLKNSDTPLMSYIMLKAFKEWLVNRIEIIENASNLERDKIYDPESFMMVPSEERDVLLTQVMDSLYVTNQRFKNIEKVVSLDFEVIILLGYIYPAWKSKVARNFIPQALESLGQDNLSIDSDIKAIELLKQLTGTDEKSEEINSESIETAIGHKALQKLCKSIRDNKFEKKYIICAKPLMEAFGAYEVRLDCNDTQNLVLKNLANIDKFNKLPEIEKSKVENLGDLIRSLDELNSYALIDHLQKFMLQNKHPDLLGDVWNFVNNANKSNDQNDLLLAKIDKACSLGIMNHLNDTEARPEIAKQLFGNPKTFKFQNNTPNLLVNAMKSLQKNSTDSEAVFQNSKIINACFPSAHSLSCQKIAKEIKFQPSLEFILNSFGSNEDRDLAQETNNLYFNLTEKQDDQTVEKMIRKIMRKFKQDIATSNVNEIESSFITLMPFLKNPVFLSKQDEFSTDDYILKTLLLLHSKIKEKLDKKTMTILSDSLGNINVPDISEGSKKIIFDEIALANVLSEHILELPEELRDKVASREQVVKLADVAFLLSGKHKSFDLIENFCKNPKAKDILLSNRTFEIASYLLLKFTKDSFKPIDFPISDNIGQSTIGSVLGTSNLAKSMLAKKWKAPQQSTVSFQISEENQQENVIDKGRIEVFEKLIKRYSNLALLVINPAKISNIIEVYIDEMQSFKPGDQKRLTSGIAINRLMGCLLSIKECNIDFSPYSDTIQKALIIFLESVSIEPNINKKLMRFFENSLCKIAKRLDRSPKELRNQELWNRLLERYFVIAPEIIKFNQKKILNALDLTQPRKNSKICRREQFEERTGSLKFGAESSGPGILSARNLTNKDLILNNIKRFIENLSVDYAKTFKILEALTRSPEFATSLLNHQVFDLLLCFVANYSEVNDDEKFNCLSECLINCLQLAINDPDHKKTLNSKIHPDNLMRIFLENIENTRQSLIPKSIEALILIFVTVENTTTFFDARLPEKILEIIGPGSDWNSENASAIMLLGLMVKDPSLEKIAFDADLLGSVIQRLEADLFKPKSDVPNPIELFTNKITDLSTNQNVKKSELAAYVLGELSKYDHNSARLAQDDQGKTMIIDFYNAYEKHDNEPIIATKIIEATRNAVYSLCDETIADNQGNIDEMLAKIPEKIKKYKHLVLIPKCLQEILDFFKNKKNPVPEILPTQNLNKSNLFAQKKSFTLENSLTFKGAIVQNQANDLFSRDNLKKPILQANSSQFQSSTNMANDFVDRTESLKIGQKDQIQTSKIGGDKSFANGDDLTQSRIFKSSLALNREEQWKNRDISDIYAYIAQQLEKGLLSTEDAKMYEVANQRLDDIINRPQDGNNAYTMMNLGVPKNLRLIANSINSTNVQKYDALKLLNEFLKKTDLIPKFTNDQFYIQKSADLMNVFTNLCPEISGLKRSERDPLVEDLKFMKVLTNESEGAELALEVNQKTPIIKTMFEILKASVNDQEMKTNALEILNNLLKLQKNSAIGMDLLKNLDDIVTKNIESLPILTVLSQLVGTVLEHFDDHKKYFTDNKLLDLSKKAIERHPADRGLNNAVSKIMYELSKDFPQSHDQILGSSLTPYLSKAFSNPGSDQSLHKNVAKMVLEVGYGSPEKKKKLQKLGFSAGLITLLNMYSSPKYYDEEACADILKLIANFSTIPEGVDLLLKDGAIPAFRVFFDKYRETLPTHNKIMMATIANMSYEKNPEIVKKIINDKGLELIIDAVKFYTGKREEEPTEVTLDALANLAGDKQAVEYLENTNLIDALVDIVRSQMSDKLCYKALGCLVSLAAHEVFANKIFQKGGQDAAAQIYKTYHNDPKNLLQATKLISLLISRFPNKSQDFIKSGVPGKIISNFDEGWPFANKGRNCQKDP